MLPCRKKGKRKREEAEAAARAKEAATEEALSSGAAADDADAGMSGSDGERKKDGVEGSDNEVGEEADDMLTPAQRRFRQKQLEREVRVSLAPLRCNAFRRTLLDRSTSEGNHCPNRQKRPADCVNDVTCYASGLATGMFCFSRCLQYTLRRYHLVSGAWILIRTFRFPHRFRKHRGRKFGAWSNRLTANELKTSTPSLHP